MKKLFCVYGTLKKEFPNNYLLRNATMIGEFKTQPLYTMVSAGGFPIVMRDGKTSISCEIWETQDVNTINNIYRLEGFTGEKGNPHNWYDIDIVDTPYGKAEMFCMDKTPTRYNVVGDGVWK